MGISERKAREKEQRRSTILRAAKRLISRYGVEGMSMARLADSTELNKATLYLYFNDKEDIIDAIVHEGLLLLEECHAAMEPKTLSGLARILNLVRSTFAFYKKYPVYFHTLNHQERRKVSDRLGTSYAAKGNEIASRIFGRIAKDTRGGIEDGSIRESIDINAFTVLFYAQTYGVLHTIYAKEDIYQDVLGLDSSVIEAAALESIEQHLKARS